MTGKAPRASSGQPATPSASILTSHEMETKLDSLEEPVKHNQSEEAAVATSSPKKQILCANSNKNASKQGVLKKKWKDIGALAVARVTVLRRKPLRCPYNWSLIRQKMEDAGHESFVSRHITTSTVNFIVSSSCKQKETFSMNLEFHQIGTDGPAAYIPTNICFDQRIEYKKLRRTVWPAIRPIMILCPQTKQDEDSVIKISTTLQDSKCFALVELRTIETSARASSGTTTTFRHVDKEMLALFPSDSIAKQELGDKTVNRENYLLCMFVKLSED